MWKLNSILLNNQRGKERITRESRKYIWLFNNAGFRATTFSAVKNPCVTCSWPSLCFFQIHGFTSAGSTSCRWCHAVVFTVEKEKIFVSVDLHSSYACYSRVNFILRGMKVKTHHTYVRGCSKLNSNRQP